MLKNFFAVKVGLFCLCFEGCLLFCMVFRVLFVCFLRDVLCCYA